MKFESIKSKKFKTLAKSEMNKVNGGQILSGGNTIPNSGIIGYSSDARIGNNYSCFYGLDDRQQSMAWALANS